MIEKYKVFGGILFLWGLCGGLVIWKIFEFWGVVYFMVVTVAAYVQWTDGYFSHPEKLDGFQKGDRNN